MMEVQAQVSPVITERRNSVITKTYACSAAGYQHRAYLRGPLVALIGWGIRSLIRRR